MEKTIIKREYFEKIKEDFLKIAGVSEGEFLKEVGFAIQHINKTPQLQEATQRSLLQSILNVAQIGLSLNPVSKYAYLIPRWNRNTKQVEASLEPSYQGLMKLLTDTHTIKSIEVRLVYEGEEVIVDYAHPDKVIKHTPLIFSGETATKIRGAYSMATLNDGSKHIETMSLRQVYDCRAVSESYKAFKEKKIRTCIWVQHEGEMIRKTVIKRHFKFLPKTEALDRIEKAVELDNKIHGVRESIQDGTVDYCLRLIGTSGFNDEEKAQFETELLTMEYADQAAPMLKHMRENQLNPITHGVANGSYNATDIQDQLKDLMQTEQPELNFPDKGAQANAERQQMD